MSTWSKSRAAASAAAVSQTASLLIACLSITISTATAANLRSLPEFFRPDPFGSIVEADNHSATWSNTVQLQAARAGYISSHLIFETQGQYELSFRSPFPAELYRDCDHL